jgi:hypothetical protein
MHIFLLGHVLQQTLDPMQPFGGVRSLTSFSCDVTSLKVLQLHSLLLGKPQVRVQSISLSLSGMDSSVGVRAWQTADACATNLHLPLPGMNAASPVLYCSHMLTRTCIHPTYLSAFPPSHSLPPPPPPSSYRHHHTQAPLPVVRGRSVRCMFQEREATRRGRRYSGTDETRTSLFHLLPDNAERQCWCLGR